MPAINIVLVLSICWIIKDENCARKTMCSLTINIATRLYKTHQQKKYRELNV